MGAAAGWLTRLAGLVILGGFLVAGVALTGPAPGGYSHGSIYPWWTWTLVLAGVTAGAVVLLAPAARGGPSSRAAACVALVVGAELAGTGVVARKHWNPALGMGGFGHGQIPEVERLAVVIASAAGFATFTAVVLLLTSGVLGRRGWNGASWPTLVLAAGIVVVLPLLLAAEVGGPTLTTWGAAGLIYAGPWAAALAASAWSTGETRWALLGTVLACAVLAGIGPQMADLFTGWARGPLSMVAAALLVLGVLVVRRGAPRADAVPT
jgi:hypothetical protein